MRLILGISTFILVSNLSFLLGQQFSSSGPCNTRYVKVNTKGSIKVIGGGFEYRRNNDVICCLSKLTDDQIKNLDTSITKLGNVNCCVSNGNCALNGMRACPGSVCFGTFKASDDAGTYNAAGNLNNDNADKQINPFRCGNNGKTPPVKKVKLRFYDSNALIGYLDQTTECADSKYKYLFTFEFIALTDSRKHLEKAPRFSWCCSKKIYDDYTVDPRKVCCALVGSLSDTYTPEMMFNVENPPCCRKIYNDPPCDPNNYFPSKLKKNFLILV